MSSTSAVLYSSIANSKKIKASIVTLTVLLGSFFGHHAIFFLFLANFTEVRCEWSILHIPGGSGTCVLGSRDTGLGAGG